MTQETQFLSGRISISSSQGKERIPEPGGRHAYAAIGKLKVITGLQEKISYLCPTRAAGKKKNKDVNSIPKKRSPKKKHVQKHNWWLF